MLRISLFLVMIFVLLPFGAAGQTIYTGCVNEQTTSVCRFGVQDPSVSTDAPLEKLFPKEITFDKVPESITLFQFWSKVDTTSKCVKSWDTSPCPMVLMFNSQTDYWINVAEVIKLDPAKVTHRNVFTMTVKVLGLPGALGNDLKPLVATVTREVVVNITNLPAPPVRIPDITPIIKGTMHGASFTDRSLAPDTWFTIIGTNLGSKAMLDTPVYKVDGLEISVCGVPALIKFNSGPMGTEWQVNALIPDVNGKTSCPVVAAVGGVKSNAVTIVISDESSELFTYTNTQKGDPRSLTTLPIAFNVADQFIGPANWDVTAVPAKPGEILVLWGTGCKPRSSVTVTIAGVSARIEFAGKSKGGLGLCQINLVVPPGTPAGKQALQLSGSTVVSDLWVAEIPKPVSDSSLDNN